MLVYRYALSPFMPGSCRYAPSCSAYALEALERHGALRGGWLAVLRVLRCHPWGGEGWDPVPPDPATDHSARRARHAACRCPSPDASEPIGRPL